MKKINISLLLSLILIAIGYRGFREFSLLRRGNKLSINKNYSEADKKFKDVISKYDSDFAKSNSMVNLYEGTLYRELLDTTNNYYFHRGNSEVYLADKEQNLESQIEAYKKALEEYRFAMKDSDDINIKKNYEIIVKRIEMVKKQQQNQENKDNKDQENKDSQNQDSNKSNNQEKKQDNDKQQNNQNQDKSSSDSDQNKDNEKEHPEKNNDQNQEQNNDNTQKSLENKKQENSTEIKEALATLERLETNEEQAFKNNERLEYLGGDTDESW